MVRPRKPEKEKVTPTIAFRVNQDDYDKFEAKCAAAGLTKSEFFRDHVIHNTTQVIPALPPSADARRAVFLLQKASNNLNQLAHRANVANRAGQLGDATFEALVGQLCQLNQFMQDQAAGASK